MHRQDNGIIRLGDLLAKLPDNMWSWSVLYFYGVGVPPLGMTMTEFENTVRTTPEGYHFSWRDLKSFAANLEQIFDCLIVAVESDADLVPAELKVDNFERCQLVLQALDSTRWSVGSKIETTLDDLSIKLQTRSQGE